MHKARLTTFLLFLLLSLLAVSCTGGAALQRPEAMWSGMQPIRARILLLIPNEFERYVYVSSYEGRDMPHPLGEHAVNLLEMLLHNAFTFSTSLPVRSEAEAMNMINPDDPDASQYDFVAIPTFTGVNSWNRNYEYGFDVNVRLTFYSPHIDKETTIGGHGETRTGAVSGTSPQESARIALSYAIDAIKDGIEARRSFFYR